MLTRPPSTLARRRLTDFFEGAGHMGRKQTVLALFQGRRFIIGLLWLFCQSVIGLFLLVGPHASLLSITAGPAAISLILGSACLGVLWKDNRARLGIDTEVDSAWRRARDRSVSRLAIFSLSLVVGGALAVLWSNYFFHRCASLL